MPFDKYCSIHDNTYAYLASIRMHNATRLLTTQRRNFMLVVSHQMSR